jgi:hypothetical protein
MMLYGHGIQLAASASTIGSRHSITPEATAAAIFKRLGPLVQLFGCATDLSRPIHNHVNECCPLPASIASHFDSLPEAKGRPIRLGH